MIRSIYIPQFLSDRYDLITDLKAAERLLQDLEKRGAASEAECEFLRSRILQMENDLKSTDTETRDYLNRFRSNNRVFVYTMMRFFVGYKWDEIGDIFGESAINVRSTVMRAFTREKAVEGKAAAAEGGSFRDSS